MTRYFLTRYIERFVLQRMANSESFTMADLLAYVRLYVPQVAPESTSRTLRKLRSLGRINYEVIHKRKFQALPDSLACGASAQ